MNVVIIYMEEREDGNVLVSVESLGEPDHALQICHEALEEITTNHQVKFLRSSIFTRPAHRVQ
jgi:hypothetical protein